MATYTSNYGWTKPSGSDNVDISVLNDNLDDQDSTIHDAFLNMAPPFSESSTYAVDDIVLYGTGLYKCHTAVVTPGSWTGSTNWQVYKLSEGGSGGGGTSNYNDLTNKPSINGVTLSGNKTTSDLGIDKTAVGLGNVPNVSTNDQTPTFSQASTRNNIASGEKLSVILGKVQKFFNDLKTVAFSGSYNDLTNKPSLATVATSGSYNDLTDKLTFDNVPTDGSNNPVKSDGVYDSEKDIYAVMGKMGAKNLLYFPYDDSDGKVDHNVTYTVNNDGTVSAIGKCDNEGPSKFFFDKDTSDQMWIKPGRYIFSGAPEGNTEGHIWCRIYHSDNTNTLYKATAGSFIFDVVETDINIRCGITFDNNMGDDNVSRLFKPMIRKISDTDDTYQPYAKTNKQLTDEIATKTKNFQGTIAEWNQLSTAEKKAYDHASITGTDGGEYNVDKTTGALEQTAGMPDTYPAEQVMMSDGVTSVEEAVDEVKSGLTNMGNVTKLGYVQGTGEVSLSDNFNNYRYLFFTVGYYDSGFPSYGTAMFPTLMAPRGVSARVVCATNDDTNAKSVEFNLNDTNNKLYVSRTFDADRYLTLYGVV